MTGDGIFPKATFNFCQGLFLTGGSAVRDSANFRSDRLLYKSGHTVPGDMLCPMSAELCPLLLGNGREPLGEAALRKVRSVRSSLSAWLGAAVSTEMNPIGF